jgi:hypothetical protein
VIDQRVRFTGRAEVIAVPPAHWRELERLSYEADPDTQRALNRLLDKRGHVLRRATARNLVHTAAKNYAGSTLFPNGSWFVGQKGTGTIAVGDTIASHGGWSELTTYTQATRPSLILGAWASGSADNSAAPAIFTAPTGGLTYYGFMVVNASGKGGTSGMLYSTADHSSPQAIAAGQALRQTLTATFS